MDTSYLDKLNDVQRQAVTTLGGPMLVVAGPGSGKTRVLTYRIAHLVNTGVPPMQILALTFTNKAAREMKERIVKVVGDRARGLWAGTFHSIFSRILRIEAEKIGYPSNFTIYDTTDSKNVLKSIVKELNLNDNYNIGSMLSRISSAKSNLVTPKLYEQNAQYRKQDERAKRPLLYQVYSKYAAKCKRAGAMDFDDLLYRFYELLHKNPDGVLEKYRDRFLHVLVDEFQDTNHLQYSIVRKLVQFEGSNYNICAVGDDAQSIYAFRGATIQNILDYESDFKKQGIKVFKLEQNYRSTDHIVQTANSIIANNRKQIPKTIWSNKGAGNKITLIETQTDAEEGKRVVEHIIEQKSRQHFSNSDIAILYRTNAQSRIFEEHLRNERIPYKIYGGTSFYDRKEIKDLIAYFRIAVNPKDEEALKRIINYPKRGIGKSSIDKIIAKAGAEEKTIWDCLLTTELGGKAKNSLAQFVTMIKGFQNKLAQNNAYEMAWMIAKQSGIWDLFKKDQSEDGKKRFEYIEELLNGVQGFVEDNTSIDSDTIVDKSLGSYLQNVALLTSLDEDGEEVEEVSLMSVHAAKGLEFKSVYIVGLEEGLFPSKMALDSDGIEGENEERRLFYVAVTRAEHMLTITYSKRRYRFGKINFTEPSRFIAEIPENSLDTAHAAKSNYYGTQSAPSVAGVKGYFKPRNSTFKNRPPVVDPLTFKPNKADEIEKGQTVLHLKFGKGKVTNIDGGKANKIATVVFDAEPDKQKRIMLKFAKLQILDS